MADSPELLKVEQPSVETEGSIEVPETSPEMAGAQEHRTELTPEEEKREEDLLKQAEQLAPAPPPPPPPPKNPVVVDLEGILADDMGDIFSGLPDDKKPLFKQKGEEVALAIKTLIDSGKVKTKNVLDLIRSWLQIVPGINKFFLEQEAKIKTDEIMQYVESKQGEAAPENQI